MISHDIFSLPNLFNLVGQSLGPFMLLQMALFHSILWLSNVPVRVCVHMYKCVYIYICLYICVYIYMSVYVCVYIYVYTHTMKYYLTIKKNNAICSNMNGPRDYLIN